MGDFLAGGLACVGACIFTNPLEVVKTRMQLQGELKKKGQTVIQFRNPIQAFTLITKTEGLRGIQKGLGPACAYQFIMNGIRLGSYGFVKLNAPIDPDRFPITASIFAASTSGGVAAVIARLVQIVKR